MNQPKPGHTPVIGPQQPNNNNRRVRILAAADLHIGRRPSHVEPAISKAFSCARAWDSIVRCAIARNVDAVLLAGDVVDAENKYFEALGPFEAGLRQLKAAGIVVVAVAGNHDFDVLPQLADAADGLLHLLGRDGTWQRLLIETRSGHCLQVVGWSFPASQLSYTPLRDYAEADLVLNPGLPVIGLLHADLDAGSGCYAPVKRHEFLTTGIPLWVLGHLHAPVYHQGSGGLPAFLYPGSAQGMDIGPGERGVRGPWLLELDAAGSIQPQHLPLAALIYDQQQVCIDTAASQPDLRQCFANAVRQCVERWQAQCSTLEVLVLRLQVHGRTVLSPAVVRAVAAELEASATAVAGVQVQVQVQTIALRPVLDLQYLAHENSLSGELARLIQALGTVAADNAEPLAEPDAELLAELLEQSATRIREVRSAPGFALLPEAAVAAPKREHCRALVLQQAWNLLETLCGQREKNNGAE